jgi:putative RNA 2'-phosphotransferase
MHKVKSPQTLAKFIAYILERRPDEFGLVTDKEGFVKIKELLKAITEEKEWKYVRRFHLDEILYSLPSPPFEIFDNQIRAKCRNYLPEARLIKDPPKLLFTCIRKRGYPSVLDKGISPAGYHHVILSSDRKLAERIGKRADQEPVILTVHVQKSVENGVRFYQAGESLFLSESIPSGCFSGPPLPKEKTEAKKTEKIDTAAQPQAAGSFLVDMNNLADRQRSAGDRSQQRKLDWKGIKKPIKKQKLKRERPPWRR